MRDFLIVGLGELVWDLLEDDSGPVVRSLGGAPVNVAVHAAALGDRAAIATRVGHDAPGDAALHELSARGVDVSAVQRDPRRPTGSVRVTLRDGRPDFAIDPGAAWWAPSWDSGWQRLFARADAVCFGTLLQHRTGGRALLQQARRTAPTALWLLDLNLRAPYDDDGALEHALAAATAVKLNEEEAARLARRYGCGDPARWLIEQRGKGLVAVTRGCRGSLLYTADQRCDHPGIALQRPHPRADPVGAGDAFSAVLVHHLLRGRSLQRINEAANRYASQVAGRPGATPVVPEPIRLEVIA